MSPDKRKKIVSLQLTFTYMRRPSLLKQKECSLLSNLYGYEDSFLTDVSEKIESWLKSMKFFLCSWWQQLIYAKPSYSCSGILEWMQIWGTVVL